MRKVSRTNDDWTQQIVDLMSGSDGYEGVTHAGVLIVARDTGAMLLAQRAADPTDASEVAETWEMPGGSLNPGEDPLTGAWREYTEEVGGPIPPHEVVHGWRAGPEDNYQGFLCAVDEQFIVNPGFTDPNEVQNVVWATPDEASTLNLRPEFAKLDLNALTAMVSGNEDPQMDPEMDEAAEYAAIPVMPIPVHGVVAPEETPTGDGRGFNAGAMSRRPLRLPFRDTATDVGGHDGAFAVGSVDRLMRADGLVQWEGLLMPAAATEAIVEKMQFFGGKYGVSVDGDQGSVDRARTETESTLWFDKIRAAGLTAVDIPAFHEAYVAFGHHPTMPNDDTLAASAYDDGSLVGGRAMTFDRGPGWVTNPVETNRIHDYWTKPGEPGFAKVGWGTPGDFTRAKALIGAKIAQHSPEKMRFLNQIIAQWHFDALGYWPGDWDKPGNDTTAEGRAKRAAAAAHGIVFRDVPTDERKKRADDGTAMPDGSFPIADEKDLRNAIQAIGRAKDPAKAKAHIKKRARALGKEDLIPDTWAVESLSDDVDAPEGTVWEAVLTSSAGERIRPPASYFTRHPNTGATVVDEADENGIHRTYGYAAEWGVCHIGYSGRCVEPPRPDNGDFPDFHLGYTRLDDGTTLNTGVLTYMVEHRDAQDILTETAQQQHFDNVANAWAAVRLGIDDRGIWFSGVVLPGVPEEDITLIEATGQVSGEWKYGSLRALQSVNVPGFGVLRSSAAFDDEGNVTALVAVTTGKDAALVASINGVAESECSATSRMHALRDAYAAVRMEALRQKAGA